MAKKKGKLASLVERHQATTEILASALAPAPAAPASLVQSPELAPAPGLPVGVTADGASPVPGEEPGFLATWWPVLAALAVGAAAFFWWDLNVWWSLGAAVGAYVLVAVARMFMG